MKKQSIVAHIEGPNNVEELMALARYGSSVKVSVRPRLYKNVIEPGRKYPSFKLCGLFTARIEGNTAVFEKTYCSGHEIAPAQAAANGFVIANTRLHRDVSSLTRSGVKCEVEPFVLAELLPGTDLACFEPRKPYGLDQFAILASIGVPVKLSMITNTRRVDDGKGGSVNELYAVYSIHCSGQDYQIETRHGAFIEGADQKVMDRAYEVALYRLDMEQHKLRRVGVEIDMGRPWSGRGESKGSLALIHGGGPEREEAESSTPLHVVQGG
jgi:hypothetical protein